MTSPKRLTQAQAVEALDAIVWTSDVVTYRDVIHAANVVLRKHAAPSVQAAFDRVIDRCNERFQPPVPSRCVTTTAAVPGPASQEKS